MQTCITDISFSIYSNTTAYGIAVFISIDRLSRRMGLYWLEVGVVVKPIQPSIFFGHTKLLIANMQAQKILMYDRIALECG